MQRSHNSEKKKNQSDREMTEMMDLPTMGINIAIIILY